MSVSEIIARAVYSVVFVFGVPGNIVILGAYYRKTPKNSTDFLIIIQAFVDLLACILPQPSLHSGSAATHNGCWFMFVSRSTTSWATVLLMGAIAFDRYATVCRPFTNWRAKPVMCAVAGGCILFALVIGLIPVMYISVILWSNGKNGCFFLSNSGSIWSTVFKVCQGIALVATFGACTFCYLRIYSVIRRQGRVRAAMAHAAPRPDISCTAATTIPTVSSQLASTDVAATGAGNSRSIEDASGGPPSQVPTLKDGNLLQSTHGNISNNPEMSVTSFHGQVSNTGCEGTTARPKVGGKAALRGGKTTKMLLCTTIFCFVTWMPYIILALVPGAYAMFVTVVANFAAFYALSGLRSLNHMINAYIYVAVNPVFRKNTIEFIAKLRCACLKRYITQ